MKILALIAALFLAGCASTHHAAYSTGRDPYPVEPQTVTVHFLDADEWSAHTNSMVLRGVSYGMPGDIKGSARWRKNDAGEIVSCEIFFPAGEAPTREVLSHELKHCRVGAFHR